MRTTATFLTLALAQLAAAQSNAYGQCGGTGWTGPTTCVSGSGCVYSNPYYSQCLPGAPTATATPTCCPECPPGCG